VIGSFFLFLLLLIIAGLGAGALPILLIVFSLFFLGVSASL
jgi:hypothetical protein